MTDTVNHMRRKMLKLGGAALTLIPMTALAAKNEGLRASMKYKDSPEGDKECAGCGLFVPGKTAKDLGGCKAFPGDTEISPKGYCAAWVKKA